MDVGLLAERVHVLDQLVEVLEVHAGVLVGEVLAHGEHDVVLVHKVRHVRQHELGEGVKL